MPFVVKCRCRILYTVNKDVFDISHGTLSEAYLIEITTRERENSYTCIYKYKTFCIYKPLFVKFSIFNIDRFLRTTSPAPIYCAFKTIYMHIEYVQFLIFVLMLGVEYGLWSFLCSNRQGARTDERIQQGTSRNLVVILAWFIFQKIITFFHLPFLVLFSWKLSLINYLSDTSIKTWNWSLL